MMSSRDNSSSEAGRPRGPTGQIGGSLIGVILLCNLSACGGGGGSASSPPTVEPPAPAATGLLVPPASDDAFVEVFRRSVPASLTREISDDEVSSGSGSGSGFVSAPAPGLDGAGFSTTYRLEAAVDEHDFVKYDGERLYVAPTRGGDCCFAVEPLPDTAALLPPPPPDDGPARIRILTADAERASVREAGAIDLETGLTVEGLYIDGDSLIALLSSAWWGRHGSAFDSIIPWQNKSVGLEIYSVTDPAVPTRTLSIELDGALVNSRRIDGQVLMVTRHLPTVADLDYAPVTDEDRAANQAVLDGLTAQDLLPKIAINGEVSADTLTAEDCLITDRENVIAPDEPGYPVLTTVLLIDTASASISDALCYADAADGIYVSAGSIYLAQTVYDNPRAVDSLVHRIDVDESLTYRGSGRVAGSLVNRGQPDFRMSEAAGVLRLVTTRWQADEEDAFDHRLYTLQLAPDAPELEVLAQLPEPGSDEVIGKPNEDLFGVRFIDTRAYLVTFERIDPLYVIDLSDPTRPEILGELEVQGFSDLLHPVSDDLLLGLGDDGEGRIKVELFRVDDPASPRSQGLLLLAEDAAWSYTDARYDRRAFTYLGGADGIDRFTVPVSLGIETAAGFESRERLYMLEVQDVADPAFAQLVDQGSLEARPGPFFESRPRSVLDGDAVFYILGNQIWTGFWGRPGPALGPF